METLQRKYGIWTATAMVIGITIGSGVFFKADDVLVASGGKLSTALLAWLIGGAIMIVTASVFARIATRIERVNGLVDYFGEAYGRRAGYLVACFVTFVYEGWIIATCINAELKDAKSTLPKVLIFGASAVVAIYMLYYIGISGVLSNDEIISAGDKAPVQVLSLVFGRLGGTLLTVFVIISCLGTLNGLIMGSCRACFPWLPAASGRKRTSSPGGSTPPPTAPSTPPCSALFFRPSG